MNNQTTLSHDKTSQASPTFHLFYPMFLVASIYYFLFIGADFVTDYFLTSDQNAVLTIALWFISLIYLIGMIVWILSKPFIVKHSFDKGLRHMYIACKTRWVYYALAIEGIDLIVRIIASALENPQALLTGWGYFNTVTEVLATGVLLYFVGVLLHSKFAKFIAVVLPALRLISIVILLITDDQGTVFQTVAALYPFYLPVAFLMTGILLKKGMHRPDPFKT